MRCKIHGHPIDAFHKCPACPGGWAHIASIADASPAVALPAGDVSPTEPRQRGASGATLAPVESASAATSVDNARSSLLSVLQARVEAEPPLQRLPLLDLIPKLSPQFKRPNHLADWCLLIERAATEAVRALCSIPIRHYKTETTVHGIVWLLFRDPSLRIMFITHSFEAAAKWSKRIRQLCEAADHRAGVAKGTYGPARGWDTIAEWRNQSGGGVVVMSADQSKIGYDCNVLIVDDAINEHGAEEPATREEVDAAVTFYTARCIRNGKPGPVLIVASRFHPDDPTGRRLHRTSVEWEYVHHAAIETVCSECGRVVDANVCLWHVRAPVVDQAFAPIVLELDALRRIRAEMAESDPNERVWWAQWMNDPRPIGSDLFREPQRYTGKLPDRHFRLAYGADLAFTQGDHSDFFAMVALKIWERKAYVIEVQRTKLDAHMIESTCKGMLGRHGYAPIYSYMSGPEIGMARLMRERGVPLVPMRARYNKLVRAERTIRRWNDGDVLVPDFAVWLHGFLHRVGHFRGNDKDEGDDEVDALVSACDGAMGGTLAGKVRVLGRAYSGLNSAR